jgi:hypothetical protein
MTAPDRTRNARHTRLLRGDSGYATVWTALTGLAILLCAALLEAAVVTTATDLDGLLAPHATSADKLDRLHTAGTLDDALAHLDCQLLRRAREAADNSDVTVLQGPDADHPLPPLLLLSAAPTGHVATRLAAILAVGSRLAITGVLLGQWQGGPTWHVQADGNTSEHGAEPAISGPRLNVLDEAATADILDTASGWRSRNTAVNLASIRGGSLRRSTISSRLPASATRSWALSAIARGRYRNSRSSA